MELEIMVICIIRIDVLRLVYLEGNCDPTMGTTDPS